MGEVEIHARKKFGWMGVALTVVLWAATDFLYISPYWKLLISIPATIAAIGLIQGYTRFCAGFGLMGAFNFGDTLSKTDTVTQAEFRAKDKRKAQMIFANSILFGVLVALIAFYC